MSLSLEEVRHVAMLARLSLSSEEELRFQKQLSDILEAVDKLKALNTDGVDATSHAGLMEAIWRKDVVVPSLPPEASLKNAPSKVGTSFAVPKILE